MVVETGYCPTIGDVYRKIAQQIRYGPGITENAK
jgi:hypothetical protein